MRELLEEGKTGQLHRLIDQGNDASMVSFNQSLRRLIHHRLIDLKDGLAASDRPEELVLALRGIKSSSDKVATSDPQAPPPSGRPDGLRMRGKRYSG
jgi:Tfp pilus assembly ATPase PilU